MINIKNLLIRALGGITPDEQELSNGFCFTQGKIVALSAIKTYVEMRYGMDWRAELYKNVCEELSRTTRKGK